MKFPRILLVSSILFTGITLMNTSIAKEKVYTWKDSKGVVHYGERPPKDTQATLVRTRTGHSDPTPAPTAQEPQNTQTAPVATAAEPSLKDPERCAKARDNLDILNSGAPIRIQNEQGITVIMDPEEKKKQINITQLVIKQACE